MRSPIRLLTSLFLALSLFTAACGSDDGATVTTIGESEGSSSSSSASASAPSGATPDASGAGPTDSGSSAADGGYAYASDVSAHRLVVEDVCQVKELLDADPIDFEAVATVYREGGSSVNSDGSVRTLEGFATATDRLHGLGEFYGTPTPLDDLVTDALDGSGIAADEADAVRAQLIEKGIQNAIMVAWTDHELTTAIGKVEAGDIDPADGAAHNWDEAWAFFHGAAPDCAPFGTGNSRGDNFGTLDDDGVALANVAILDAMRAGRDAAIDGDAEDIAAAAEAVRRGIVITYSQAAIRYADNAVGAAAEGDDAEARIQQAEGYAFWRVIEAWVDAAGADTDAVNAILHLDNAPGAGDGDAIREALAPAWDALEISADDIGTLQ